MIATEDYPFTGQADLVGDALDLLAEGTGGQARITTLVVDLVAGRLDKDGGLVGSGRRRAASRTTGCAEHTEVTPASSVPAQPWRFTRVLRRLWGRPCDLVRRASSWPKLEVPSIGA